MKKKSIFNKKKIFEEIGNLSLVAAPVIPVLVKQRHVDPWDSPRQPTLLATLQANERLSQIQSRWLLKSNI